MNWTRREMLMQCLPAAADILALVPVRAADGGNETVIHSLWRPPTVRKLVREARAVHYKLLLDVRRQLHSAEALA